MLQDILDLSSTSVTTLISNFDDGACYQANGTPEALQREMLSPAALGSGRTRFVVRTGLCNTCFLATIRDLHFVLDLEF